MRNVLAGVMAFAVLFGGSAAGSNLFDKAKDYLDKDRRETPSKASPGASPAAADEKIVAPGLREALSIGSQKAVDAVARQDGSFGNPRIRIPLPENIRKVERGHCGRQG
jgi:hypothetical protein